MMAGNFLSPVQDDVVRAARSYRFTILAVHAATRCVVVDFS